jgi:hypothetical protein
MSLASLQLRTATVRYGDTDITLHGLSANAIAGIILAHGDNLEQIFDIAENAGVKSATDLADVNLLEIAQGLMSQLPGFIASVIAYAAHEPEEASKVIHLDARTQMECLSRIAKLTFEDEAGFREFLGNVTAALRSAKRVVPQSALQNLAGNASQNGGLVSGPQSLS